MIIAATHGVLSEPASQRLADCGAREVIVTNTLPIGDDSRFDQLTAPSIAPLLASTIRAVFDNGSVTELFDGSAYVPLTTTTRSAAPRVRRWTCRATTASSRRSCST